MLQSIDRLLLAIRRRVLGVDPLQVVFDSVAEGVAVFDENVRLLQWNPAAERILGLSGDQLRGVAAIDPRWGTVRSDGSPLPEDEVPAVVTRRTGQAIANFEHGIRTPDGTRRWVSVSTTPIFRRDGAIQYIIATFSDVTALREREVRYETIVQGAELGTWDTHLPTGRTHYNARWARMLGYTLDEIEPHIRAWEERVHPDDRESVKAALQAHLDGLSDEFKSEHRLRRRDGTWAWVLDTGRVVERAADGTPLRAAGVHLDISSLKQLTEELARTSEQLNGFFAAALDLWAVANLRGEFLQLSPAWAELLGEPISALIGRQSTDFVHPDDVAATRVTRHGVTERRQAIRRFENRYRRADGSWCWLEWQVVARGEFIYASARDVTARKDAAHRLTVVATELEEAQAVARMGNWSMEVATGELGWSVAVARLFGTTAALLPRSLQGMLMQFADPDATRLRSAFESTMSEGTSFSLLLDARHDSRGARHLLVEGRARRDDRGRITTVYGTCADRTAEVQRELALREAQAAAEAASRSKSEFLANMSHEIRTPLTAILGYAEILRDDAATTSAEERRHAVATIHRAGAHLLQVINDILDLSKIESGKLVVEQTETPFLTLLQDVETMLAASAEAKGLALAVQLTTPVPEVLVTDATRLRQILVNLVGNAVKFTETGRVDVRVGVLNGQPRRLRIAIEDTGPGLSSEAAARLFQPFTQADESITRRFGGTGLGLAICRRLAGLLGGTVQLERTVLGEGSCFTLNLPLAMPNGARMQTTLRPDAAHLPGPAADREAPVSLVRSRILYAEDGIDNQKLVGFILRQAGADVVTAADGAAALAAFDAAEAEGAPFDLLITDVQMPTMNGYTLARTLRSRGSQLPIIALTAHAAAEERARCLAAGCDDYASKPIDRLLLLRMCRRWLYDRSQAVSAPASSPSPEPPAVGRRPAASQEPLRSELADVPALAPLVGEFVQELPSRLKALREALAAGTPADVARLAHQLAGAGGSYGFPMLSEVARALEISALTPDTDRQRALLNEADALAARMAAGLELAAEQT